MCAERIGGLKIIDIVLKLIAPFTLRKILIFRFLLCLDTLLMNNIVQNKSKE